MVAAVIAMMLLILASVAATTTKTASTASLQASPSSPSLSSFVFFNPWSDRRRRLSPSSRHQYDQSNIITSTSTTRNSAPSLEVKETTPPRSRLPLFRFATTSNHNGNAMDDSDYHHARNSMTSPTMTPPISPNSKTISSNDSSSSSIRHESTDRNCRDYNQRPPRWQPQKSTSPPDRTGTTGADALATEMENASRRTIIDNYYALQKHQSPSSSSSSFQQTQQQQQQQQQQHSEINGNCYYQDNDDGDNDNDPHVMEFANYLFALQAKMESELEKSTSTTTTTTTITYDTSMSDASSISAVTMREMQQQMEEKEKREDTVPITAEDDIMGDSFLKMLSNEVRYKQLINQSPYSLADVEFSVLIQRFLDNIEDGMQKKNGKFAGMSKLKQISMPRENRKTIVVVGTGWASHSFVKLASTYDLRIVVVSPVNHFVFTPMLASAAVGTVEYRSMTEPIRVTNPYIDNFVEGHAVGVDVDARKLIVQLTSMSTVTGAFKGVAATAPCRLEPDPVLTQLIYDEDGIPRRDETQGAGGVIELFYDHLICAVGTASNSGVIPGAKEHCFNLKTAQDSKRLRTAIGEALELASRPDVQEYYYQEEDDEEKRVQAQEERRRRVRVAVVGGGPTGVELSGELCDFFNQICRDPDAPYHRLAEDVSVLLVHGGSDLLPAMDPELRERALCALQAQGVDVRLNTRLNEVGRDYIKVCKKESGIVETIPLGFTVWAAGNAPVPFVKELLSQLPESAMGSGGRINVDKWMRCPTHSSNTFGSILVLGDVACSEARYKYDLSPSPLPQTAQVAGQQGAFVARMLNRGYHLQQTPPKLPVLPDSEAFSLLRSWLLARGLEESPGFNFLSLGLLAYVGQEEALNQVMLGNVPLFNYSGRIAFALWRSVYLAKQASSRNQALIAFDWLRTETFGRDITRL